MFEENFIYIIKQKSSKNVYKQTSFYKNLIKLAFNSSSE